MIGCFVSWAILLKKKINLRDYKFYLSLLILTFILIFNYNNVDKMLKYTLITFALATFIKFNFKENIKVSIVTAFYTQITNIIPELIYSIILIAIFGVETGEYSPIVVFFANTFVGIGSILLVKIRFIRKIYNSIIGVVNKLSLKTLLLWLLPICFILNIYLAITYYKYNSVYFVIINNVSLYFVVGIILILIKKENEYIKIYDKYNTTLNSLKEYEDILDKYRISNHENKNQLLTIRNMISDKNKKTIKYIDEIVQNKLKDDEKIMYEVSIIPAGGLRGLVYSKILYMKQNEIDYELNISKDVRTVDLINKLDDLDMLDICQIIGVYIDNSIEAVANIKDKYINIEMYFEEENLIFSISNYYEGEIELEKLEQKGYTTKGLGHGYGLNLTKKIIENNKKLKNEKKISKRTFTQILKIKML
ncbi:MAG: GHKL domain-containing protein [Bacilli bacterium]|nr:GHKL domain-containing protein [Bacilli bacterium]